MQDLHLFYFHAWLKNNTLFIKMTSFFEWVFISVLTANWRPTYDVVKWWMVMPRVIKSRVAQKLILIAFWRFIYKLWIELFLIPIFIIHISPKCIRRVCVLWKTRGLSRTFSPKACTYSSALWNWIMDPLQLFCNIKGTYVLSIAAGMEEARRHMFFYGLL